MNETSRLLNIVKLSSKNKEYNYSSQVFNITKIVIHIVLLKTFSFLCVLNTLFLNTNSK